MHNKISKEARAEVLVALRARYQQALKQEKTKVVDEFIAVTGCHRKHAIRLLSDSGTARPRAVAVGRRIYGDAVREALIVLWEAADRICGKRLKALLPSLVEALERHGHIALDDAVRQRLLSASAATLDRLLASIRNNTSRRKKRKTSTKPSRQVPIRTFADWKEPTPGFLEIDFVAHGGSSVEGTLVWSLAATDVCTGWTEVVPLVAREQSLVAEGLEAAKERLRTEGGRLDPWQLLQRIRAGQSALAALGSGNVGGGAERESLEQFLAKLPGAVRIRAPLLRP